MKESVVALIPARGGSKGIPGKNLAQLNGRPLIHYTISVARQSELIERVFVSTEDPLIKAAALECCAEVIERPAHLAEDETPTLPVLQHAVFHLETVGCLPTIVVLLQPTVPYRKAEDIDNAIRMLVDRDADAVVGVVRSETSRNWIFQLEEGRAKFYETPDFNSVRRQVAPQDYRVNGSIYVYRVAIIRAATGYAWGRNVYGYIMDKSSSLDIDEPFDLELAELLLTTTASRSNGTSR
jgi:CMP-N,N'-diacetyllegionaminic acid synthase